MHRGLAGTALALALLSGTAVSCGTEKATPVAADEPRRATPADWPDLVDSAELDTPVVATGTVVDDGGALLPDVPVVLMADPSEEFMQAMEDGDTYQSQEVAIAWTDDEGSFALRVEDAKSLLPNAGAVGGFVNLEVMTFDERVSMGLWHFPMELLRDDAGSYYLHDESGPLEVALNSDEPVAPSGHVMETPDWGDLAEVE